MAEVCQQAASPLISLALYHGLDWWWADRIAALAVAVVAAAEAWHTASS
jgi:divalent metal cation (Fe/Co/Zn/Cd) transporter